MKIKLLQINKSHSSFTTKQDELAHPMEDEKADICAISKANKGGEDDGAIVVRNNLFSNMNFEDKYIYNDILFAQVCSTQLSAHLFHIQYLPNWIFSIKHLPWNMKQMRFISHHKVLLTMHTLIERLTQQYRLFTFWITHWS